MAISMHDIELLAFSDDAEYLLKGIIEAYKQIHAHGYTIYEERSAKKRIRANMQDLKEYLKEAEATCEEHKAEYEESNRPFSKKQQETFLKALNEALKKFSDSVEPVTEKQTRLSKVDNKYRLEIFDLTETQLEIFQKKISNIYLFVIGKVDFVKGASVEKDNRLVYFTK